MTPRERVLKLLLRIMNNPRIYTRQQLANYFNASKKSIGQDIDAINSLPELTLHYQEPPHRCYVEINNRYSDLNALQALNEEDRYHIQRALDYLGNPRLAQQLKVKVAGLYDFQQLGFRQLRHPAIERINRLEGAKERRQKVKLIRYRSNSNEIKDRIVEPFLIDAELDTLQAYDYIREESRHFRLSRIERVQLLDEPWENSTRHQTRATDVFRIADNDQVLVRLRLKVQAYNFLMENYPMAASYTEPDHEENRFIFEARVNGKYLALSNFIMGYAADVDILAPADLREFIRRAAEKILSTFTA